MANKTITQLTAAASAAAADEMEIQKSGETTTKKVTVSQVLATEATARAAQDDVIEAGVGLAANGTFTTLANSYNLTAADYTAGITDGGGASGALTQNVVNGLRILDAKIAEIESTAVSSVLTKDITLSTADVLSLNAAPKVLLQGLSGRYYEIISAVAYNNFNSAAFEAGTAKLEIKYLGGATIFEFANAFIESGADAMYRAIPTTNDVMTVASVVAYCGTAPTPATGDGSITISITYRIHEP